MLDFNYKIIRIIFYADNDIKSIENGHFEPWLILILMTAGTNGSLMELLTELGHFSYFFRGTLFQARIIQNRLV